MNKEPEYHASLLAGAEPWAIEQVKEDRERLEAEVARLTAELAGQTEATAIANRSADDQMQQKREAQAEVTRLRENLLDAHDKLGPLCVDVARLREALIRIHTAWVTAEEEDEICDAIMDGIDAVRVRGEGKYSERINASM